MGIFRVFRYSEVLGGPRNRTLSYYKSVGIRHFFGNIEGGPLSGGPPPPYAREKVRIRLLRGRSDFDVLKNRQNPQKMCKNGQNRQNPISTWLKTGGPSGAPPGAPPGPGGPLRGPGGPSGPRRAPPGPLRGPLIVGATGTAGRAPSF